MSALHTGALPPHARPRWPLERGRALAEADQQAPLARRRASCAAGAAAHTTHAAAQVTRWEALWPSWQPRSLPACCRTPPSRCTPLGRRGWAARNGGSDARHDGPSACTCTVEFPLETCQAGSFCSAGLWAICTPADAPHAAPAPLQPCQVGNAAFAAEYRGLVPDSWGVVNDQDPVPRIPGYGAASSWNGGRRRAEGERWSVGPLGVHSLRSRKAGLSPAKRRCAPPAGCLPAQQTHLPHLPPAVLHAWRCAGFRHCCSPVVVNARGDIIVKPSYFERSVLSRWVAIGAAWLSPCVLHIQEKSL